MWFGEQDSLFVLILMISEVSYLFVVWDLIISLLLCPCGDYFWGVFAFEGF